VFSTGQPIRFNDGVFILYTAYYGSWANDRRIVFRVREDRDPYERAAEKDILDFDRVTWSDEHEIAAWVDHHPDHQPIT
jgi:hypothetical protein